MNEKIDNQLNMALQLTPEELNKSQELSVGFDTETDSWDLIIRYTDLEEVKKIPGIDIKELTADYAIVTVPSNQIDNLANIKEVIYIEKPKSLELSFENGKNRSCINEVQIERNLLDIDISNPYGLFGQGVIIGIVDSGIDYLDSVFVDEQGSTRILRLWDQVIDRVYTDEDINNALENENPLSVVPSEDISGHGTNVAKIAAGNFSVDKSRNNGIATQSKLVVVKMTSSDNRGFPRTTQLMEGVDFIVKTANELRMPFVINISFGNTYGSHDGTSLISTYLDSVINDNVTVICIGSGNEGNSAGHVRNNIKDINEVELQVGKFQLSFSVQLWKDYVDKFAIEIVAPSGESTSIIMEGNQVNKFTLQQTRVAVLFGGPKPYSPFQEIYIQFIPINRYVNEGIWLFRLIPENTVYGNYDMWLPASNAISKDTFFLKPDVNTTLTVPSATNKAITVGAYNSRNDVVADFSGRGFTRENNQVKPDIVAPGVDVRIPGGDMVSGTSFSTPFVTGSVALMMEWGIVRGNDRFLYGEKVKAYLIRGARQLPQIKQWPNPEVGWGALCLEESIPRG